MNPFIIPQTRLSPEVNFDYSNRCLQIRGRCYPEDVVSFFHPIITEFQAYCVSLVKRKETLDIYFMIQLEYCNSSSYKMFSILFETIAEYQKKGISIKPRIEVNKEEDEDIIDMMEQIKLVTGSEFEFVYS